MLGPPLSDTLSPDDLRSRFQAMYRGYAQGQPQKVWFDEEFSAVDWAAKQAGDVGWAYVAIEGEGFVEAVTVTVSERAGRLFVRNIEWGRP